jgi:hypothetical protein
MKKEGEEDRRFGYDVIAAHAQSNKFQVGSELTI